MDNYIDAYDEKEWNLLTQPVLKNDTNSENEPDILREESAETIKIKKSKSSPILTFQLVLCLVVLIVLFLLKTFAINTFTEIKSWYDTELTASLFFSGDFSELDYSSMFSSTNDEI